MEPVTPNAPSQGTAQISDSRSDKVSLDGITQSPDRQPLVAPPLPVTGNSQIAAVVKGLLPSELEPPQAREPEEPERVLKPFGIGMLPEGTKTDDAPEDAKSPTDVFADVRSPSITDQTQSSAQSETATDASKITSPQDPAAEPEVADQPEEQRPK